MFPTRFWKIYIPLYFYFTGLSAGSLFYPHYRLYLALKRFKLMALPAAIISFVLLLLAPACSIMDLHQPLRFWHTLVPNTSIGLRPCHTGLGYTLYPIANLIYIYFIFVKNDKVTKVSWDLNSSTGNFCSRLYGFCVCSGSSQSMVSIHL